ncbi:MAG: hypothetical protein HOG33_01960 [Candidatus Marinimicrobia bacterium]|jgi:hypothetical protein|nr:hypothetical protein [Candidatus Neomarinimicrobiota bacterium]MDC0865552.1 hypothetical protein [bacterium]MBT3796836.1 hypothetical protein [Candidatus Neomarinimicrobiota bacterium]MBT4148821.1 hypothetical protein [Candidatus Neomarinimicrobiota bacterium]MBT4785194.1 hypothetical protein [Candidatus Neomarinimicrobiota bacterium]|tara:strand:- start:2218 stop:2682 length:465 start_codon:yes stop_codon:yes gene_type:complete
MKSIIKRIAILLVLSAISTGQLRSSLPERTIPINSQGLSQARNLPLLDFNRLNINHSFDISMMSAGNQSMTMGAYTNQMNYMLKDNLLLSTQFSLASPMGGMNPYANNGLNGAQLYYGASLNYKPMKNLFLKLSMNNYPQNNYRRPFNSFYNIR